MLFASFSGKRILEEQFCQIEKQNIGYERMVKVNRYSSK
jgi:hypothetical protein